MNDKLLEIIIKARDQASNVMAKVGDSMQRTNQQAQNLAQKGFADIQRAGQSMVAGLAIGIPIIAGALGGMAIKAGVAQAQMQTMSVALETSMGGNIELAKEAQKNITDFASRTPYQIGEVMNAFIKLKNMGLDPSNEALTSYGDTASAMGKTLNDMIEAVADAATGEFERLKEFGIRSKSEGDKVSFTFKGITTTVGKNAEEIEKYLINLGKTNFAGGMAKQSETLAGLFSTLTDTINIKLAGAFDKLGGTQTATNLFKQLTTTIESIDIDKIIKTIGDSFAYMTEQAQKLVAQLRDEPIVQELEKLWATVDQVLMYQSVLVGIGGVLVALAVIAVASFAVVAYSALTVAAPFIALGVAIAALYYMWQTNFMGIQGFTAQLFEQLQPVFQQIGTELQALGNDLLELWNVLSPVLIPTLQFLAVVIGGVLYTSVVLLIQIFLSMVQVIRIVVRTAIDIFSSFSLAWQGVSKLFVSLIQGDMQGALRGLSMFAQGIFNGIVAVIRGAMNLARTPVNTMIRTYNKVNDTFGGADISELPAFALGTTYAKGGLSLVGENGPELVNLPRGSRVNTASTTANMSGGGGVTINMQIGSFLGTAKDRRELVDALYNELSNLKPA